MKSETQLSAPFAQVFGCDVVTLAQAYSGKWIVLEWLSSSGPDIAGSHEEYSDALAHGKRLVACMSGGILDVPRHFSRMHVVSNDNGYEVLHEGRSGENFASLGSFGHQEYDEALAFARSQLGQYAPCLMGEVCSCHF